MGRPNVGPMVVYTKSSTFNRSEEHTSELLSPVHLVCRLLLEKKKTHAEYERLADECRATADRIRRDGFGRHRRFESLICRRGDTAIGFALYFFTYSTFIARPTLYLEDLFVLPDARGRGAGRALLTALARIAVRRGCGRMEWTVLDWNTPSIDFYEALGARLRRDWILTRL